MATGLRQTQIVIEALVVSEPEMVSAQQVLEVLATFNSSLESSQLVAEVLMDPGAVNQDCSQLVVEVLAFLPFAQLGNGTLSLGESAEVKPTYLYNASGTLSFGGAGEYSNIGYITDGVLSLSSSVDVVVYYIYNASGGLSFYNGVAFKPTYLYRSSGSLLLGSESDLMPSYIYEASGHRRLTGTFVPPVYTYEASGGLNLGFVANTASSYWIYETLGGLTFGQAAYVESSSWTYEASGGLFFGGAAQIGRVFDYNVEPETLVLSGSVDVHFLIEYEASGSIGTLTGPDIAPNFNQLVRMTFTWDMSQGVMRNWRVEGKCRPANHPCPPTHVEADTNCGGEMQFVMSIQARSITDLCQKLKRRGWLGPILKIQKWSLPANKVDWASTVDPACNTLEDIPFDVIPDCIDFTVDHDIKVGAKAGVRLIFDGTFSYVASGGLGYGETQVEVFSGFYGYVASGGLGLGESADNDSPEYHIYVASGGLGFVNGFESYTSALGTRRAGARAIMQVMDLSMVFGTTAAPVLTIPTDLVQATCCVDLFLPTILFVSQELTRSDNLSNFFTVNDFTLDRVQRLRYSQNRNSWFSNLNYRGVSVDNAQDEEIWSIIIEFGCLTENAILGIPSNVWGFSILIRKQITSKSKITVTRLVLEFNPTSVCDLINALTFSFTLDTILRQTTPSVVRTLVFDDELGIFNGSGYEENPVTSFEISLSAPPPGAVMFDQSVLLRKLLVNELIT